MKKITLIIFLLTVINLKSQEICGSINYKTKGYITTYSIMNFNENFSYNRELVVKLTKDEKEKINQESGNTTTNIIVGSKNLEPFFEYNDRTNFYFNEEYIDGTIDIIKEDKRKWNWNILPDTKKIGEFICKKATTNFRGSDFTAWFTSEIPLPFGPWKAKDLPGVILELYDGNNLIHITTTNVTLKSKNKCKIPVDKKKLNTAITIKGFLKKQKLKDKEYFSMLNSKLPKGAKPYKLAEDCDDCPKELKLENFNEQN